MRRMYLDIVDPHAAPFRFRGDETRQLGLVEGAQHQVRVGISNPSACVLRTTIVLWGVGGVLPQATVEAHGVAESPEGNVSEDEPVTTRTVASPTGSIAGGFVAAGALGVIHAGFSFYWAAGGTVLVWSLGTGMVESFRGREWLLFPIAVVKLAAAVVPLVLARLRWPARRVTRWACWLGALFLVFWGGLNTVVGNLVLAGVIRPESGYDRPGMIGHAYLWDPLFLTWGVALIMGLVASRIRAVAAR